MPPGQATSQQVSSLSLQATLLPMSHKVNSALVPTAIFRVTSGAHSPVMASHILMVEGVSASAPAQEHDAGGNAHGTHDPFS